MNNNESDSQKCEYNGDKIKRSKETSDNYVNCLISVHCISSLLPIQNANIEKMLYCIE